MGTQITIDEFFKRFEQTIFSRLNLDPTDTHASVLEFLSQKYTHIIVSQENATRPHFHVLLTYTESNSKNANQNFKNYIKTKWDLSGNSDYAVTQTQKGTTHRLAAYTIKDGNFSSIGFSELEMSNFKKLSYKKYTKQDFQNELNAINDKFLLDPKMEIRDYISSYCILKTAYNQNLNVNTICNYINLINARKYGTSEISLAVFNKFNNQ